MTKTGAMLVAVLLSGCGLYSGGDDATDPNMLVGEWSMQVDLNPCIASPASIVVAFEINEAQPGSVPMLGGVEVAGGGIVNVGLDLQQSLVWIDTESADWNITIWDDGDVAGALVEYTDRDDGCSVETQPVVTRVR